MGLFLLSAFLLIAGLAGLIESEYAITLSIVGVFLGVTNLGRSCPLILSIRYWTKKRASKQRS
ncbi:MAG: hypothetical protein FJ217_02675 [Ignavibacteria bacterium]|nr:hypothetical protein [Ignavibacteria bacterium]